MPANFASRLRTARLAAALSQSELAARLGVSPARVGHMEQGTYGEPTLETKLRLAAALGCDPSALDARLAPAR